MKEGVVRAADALQSPWLIGAFFLMLILLAWSNVRNPSKLRLLLRTTLMVSPPKQVFREDIDMQDRLVLALMAIAVLSISVFTYQMGVLSGYLAPEQSSLYAVILACTLVILLSFLVVRLMGWLFNTTEGLIQYTYHCILQLILLGLLLIPLSLMLTFAPIPRDMLVVIGSVLMLLVLILRWFRGFLLGINAGIPLIYIVLYLCAAEILPALIGLKVLGVSPLV